MAGKWASFREKLPAFTVEQSYQAKVDDAKQFLLGTLSGEDANINRLAALYADRKQKKDAHEVAISEINVDLEALSQLLCDAFETEGMQKVELSSGASGYLHDGIYPSVEDREKLFDWIKQHKMARLLSVNAQTLKGLVGELLQNGKPAPAGVRVFLKTQFRIRGVNQSNGDE